MESWDGKKGQFEFQLVLSSIFLALWFLGVFQEIRFLINFFAAVVATGMLLIICNRSRRWGAISGGVLYLLLIILAYSNDAQCFSLGREGDLCGLITSMAYAYGWALIPFCIFIDAMIGWMPRR